MTYRPPLSTEQKYRVLNRHRRGRPRYGLLKRLKKISIRLALLAFAMLVIGGALYTMWLAANWLNLL